MTNDIKGGGRDARLLHPSPNADDGGHLVGLDPIPVSYLRELGHRADCTSDAERLDVYNGLLLAAHVDAAFDAHLLSCDEGGRVIYAPALSEADRRRLRLGEDARITGLTEHHQKRLVRHRAQLEG